MDDVKNLIFVFVLYAAAVVALLTGLVKLGSAILQIRRTNPRGCAIAEGRVISHELDRTSHGEFPKFTLDVRYEYHVLGIRREAQYNHKSDDIRERDRLASLYQPESRIRVHYDPSDPDRCWLNYGERARARDKLVYGLILTAAGVFILALGLMREPVIRYLDNPTVPIHPYFWIAIGFALFLGLFFLLFAISEFHLLRPRNWATIEGRVISVKTSDYASDTGGMVYGLDVLYEYIVEGIEIRSHYDGGRDSESERDEIAPLYQPDHKIIVHFDPADPSISWIDKRHSEAPRKILITGVQLIVVAILIFVIAVFVAY